MQPSNFNDLLSRELVQRMIFSVKTARTSLLNHVGHIFRMCSSPEMFKIHACRFVPSGAVVQNAQSFWYRTFVQNPRGNVCTNTFGVFGPGSPSSTYPSIPSVGTSCRPEPAGIGLVDLGPEAAWKRWGKSLRSKVFCCNFDHVKLVLPCGLLARAAFSLCQQWLKTSIQISRSLVEVGGAPVLWFPAHRFPATQSLCQIE